jgi:hypothetical protein
MDQHLLVNKPRFTSKTPTVPTSTINLNRAELKESKSRHSLIQTQANHPWSSGDPGLSPQQNKQTKHQCSKPQFISPTGETKHQVQKIIACLNGKAKK